MRQPSKLKFSRCVNAGAVYFWRNWGDPPDCEPALTSPRRIAINLRMSPSELRPKRRPPIDPEKARKIGEKLDAWMAQSDTIYGKDPSARDANRLWNFDLRSDALELGQRCFAAGLPVAIGAILAAGCNAMGSAIYATSHWGWSGLGKGGIAEVLLENFEVNLHLKWWFFLPALLWMLFWARRMFSLPKTGNSQLAGVTLMVSGWCCFLSNTPRDFSFYGPMLFTTLALIFVGWQMHVALQRPQFVLKGFLWLRRVLDFVYEPKSADAYEPEEAERFPGPTD